MLGIVVRQSSRGSLVHSLATVVVSCQNSSPLITTTTDYFSCSSLSSVHNSQTQRSSLHTSACTQQASPFNFSFFKRKPAETKEDVEKKEETKEATIESKKTAAQVNARVHVHPAIHFEFFDEKAIEDPRFYNPIYDLLPRERVKKYASDHKHAVQTHSLTNAHSNVPTVPFDILAIRVAKNMNEKKQHWQALSPSQHILRYLIANGTTSRKDLLHNINSLASKPVFASSREITRYLQVLVARNKVKAKPKGDSATKFVYYVRDYTKAPHVRKLIAEKEAKDLAELQKAKEGAAISEAEVIS